MSKKKIARQANEMTKPAPLSRVRAADHKRSVLPWILVIVGITAVCLFPMLDNDFTNWDDEYYVINNALLVGPDWKGIFTTPLVGNYHPLTVATLALNFQISQLDPSSYLGLNLLFHLTNTALVFYFIRNITDKKAGVAAFTALIFGIHPMHVESVAWVSERKDVLYTLFFLLSLIQYWKYLERNKQANLWLSFSLFVFSLLSKPAAVILPLVLFLLDYWKGRSFSMKVALEKFPFLIAALIFGLITLNVQTEAMAGLETYSIPVRLLFACYVVMIYFIRFFVPYPLSAYHPYPPTDNLGWDVYIAPVFIIAMILFLWWQRKDKAIVFGISFFVVNLLLVLQIISIGLTIVSERYTYVPYIGLAFAIGMLLNRYFGAASKTLVVSFFLAVTIVFGAISYQRADVWQNSGSLWTDVISHYPETTYPRTNRANYLAKKALEPEYKSQRESLYAQALEDCNIALDLDPDMAKGYEQRALIYQDLGQQDKAFSDADSLLRLEPKNKLGYYIRGTIYAHRNEIDKAMEDYDKCLSIYPDYDKVLNNRGTLLANHYQKYTEALNDYNNAIRVNPKPDYYLNRSICYYKMGDMNKARADASVAMQNGMHIPDNYRQILNQ